MEQRCLLLGERPHERRRLDQPAVGPLRAVLRPDGGEARVAELPRGLVAPQADVVGGEEPLKLPAEGAGAARRRDAELVAEPLEGAGRPARTVRHLLGRSMRVIWWAAKVRGVWKEARQLADAEGVVGLIPPARHDELRGRRAHTSACAPILL